jgi:hypothetical protein
MFDTEDFENFENFDGIEGLDNVSAANATKAKQASSSSYNPRLFQPAIAEQVADSNFIPLPTEAEYPWAKNTGNYGEADILDDGGLGNLGLNFNMFSKACCGIGVWPAPHSVTPDDFILMSGKEFVPSSYKGNNAWQDSGCACLTKEQALFMNRRGSNAYNEI